MNKNIELTKNIKVLFGVNLFIIISIFLFRLIYNDLGYYTLLVNIMTIINILFIIFGITYNILMLVKKEQFDNKNGFIIIVIFGIIYLIINTLGIYLINKSIQSKYNKYSDKLYKYCELYECETYEVISKNDKKEYIIENNYLDYNNNLNGIKLIALYDINGIYKISATIISDNELYSEDLIKEQIDNYFNYFDKKINKELIKEAFDLRFDGDIKENEYVYKVTEVYDEKILSKIKTEIIVKLR